MTSNFQFPKFLSFFLLLFFVSKGIVAQTGNNVPFSTNPFGANPITNPFGGNTQTGDKKKSDDKKTTPTKEEILNSAKEASDPDKKKTTEEKKLDDENLADENTDKKDENGEIIKSKNTTGSTQFDHSNDIYGMDYFTNSVFNMSDKNTLTPPMDYRLGVGDEIVVNIYGQSETQQNYTIGRDGSISPRYIGKIYLQGMTFENAKNVIQNKFRSIVAASTIDVQLGKIRTIKVTIIGEVNRNGTSTFSAFTTAISAIANAGGITKLGNLRNIEIKRNGRIVNTIDLYEFIRNGGSLEDQYLEDGDIINVGTYEKLVKAEGSFKRPMYYQLKENENLNNLIDLAGGPAFDARFSSVQIKSIIGEQPRILTVNLKDVNNKNETYALFDGDIISIKKINPNFSNTVLIEGAVNYPDIYQVNNGDKLSTIIEKAGGLQSDAFTARAYIFRGDTNFSTEASKIDLNELLSGNMKNDIEILPGDRISIISKRNFTTSYAVEISGSVRKPTIMPYIKNMRLKDLLISAGGLTSDAESGRIEIASLVDSADNYELKIKKVTTWKTILINPNLELDKESENIILHPFDKIYVRRKIAYRLMEKVIIEGEVNYPGEYPLTAENEKLTMLIEKAGGLKPTAFIEGANFYRSNIGLISMDLKKILKYKNTKDNYYDLILKNDDRIIIPKKNEMVSIVGQVNQNINLFGEPNPTSVRTYVNAAGGFDDRPWKDRISVLYPNGKIKTTKRLFFIRKYPKVVQGCIVNVPKKPERKSWQIQWSDLGSFGSSALSAMATMVTAYAILTK